MDIDLSPFVATPENPNPRVTPDIQAAALDPEVKRILEALVVQIRRQAYVRPEFGGAAAMVSRAEFNALQASVAKDLLELRKSIVGIDSKLDKDAGVADTDYGKKCDPPPLETRPPL